MDLAVPVREADLDFERPLAISSVIASHPSLQVELF
jgi:hypothetical protein